MSPRLLKIIFTYRNSQTSVVSLVKCFFLDQLNQTQEISSKTLKNDRQLAYQAIKKDCDVVTPSKLFLCKGQVMCLCLKTHFMVIGRVERKLRHFFANSSSKIEQKATFLPLKVRFSALLRDKFGKNYPQLSFYASDDHKMGFQT